MEVEHEEQDIGDIFL